MKILVKVEHREGMCVGGDLTFGDATASWEVCEEEGRCVVDMGKNVPATFRAAIEQLLKDWICPAGTFNARSSGSKTLDLPDAH